MVDHAVGTPEVREATEGSEPNADDLDGWRAEIDRLDDRIQRLVNARAHCAIQIGRCKDLVGAPHYRPDREAQVLQRIKQRNQGPLEADAVARLFREIMSACLALEKPLVVAYLGPEGTFTHAATERHFGTAVHGLAQPSIELVFREVQNGHADFGVVPVENSTEGMVNQTLDCLLETQLRICGEVELAVQHCLLARKDASIDRIELLLSHAQSFAQCRGWLNRYHPGLRWEAAFSNAEAARRAANDPQIAAIAGDLAARIHGLKPLHTNIQDRAGNSTRFLVLGRRSIPPSGADRTSILVRARACAGSLRAALAPLERCGISMTRIWSRPARDDGWSYVFFIDFNGHEEDDQVAEALRGIAAETLSMRVLGCYPVPVIAGNSG